MSVDVVGADRDVIELAGLAIIHVIDSSGSSSGVPGCTVTRSDWITPIRLSMRASLMFSDDSDGIHSSTKSQSVWPAFFTLKPIPGNAIANLDIRSTIRLNSAEGDLNEFFRTTLL